MSISIKGIRLDRLTVERDEDGKNKLTGSYSLMSNTDNVLAKQAFNGYNDIELNPSATTVAALREFVELVKDDLHAVLGIETK